MSTHWPWVKNLVTVVVLAGWMFNLAAPAFVSSYNSNLAANAPLMLVLGAMFATRNRGEEDDD